MTLSIYIFGIAETFSVPWNTKSNFIYKKNKLKLQTSWMSSCNNFQHNHSTSKISCTTNLPHIYHTTNACYHLLTIKDRYQFILSPVKTLNLPTLHAPLPLARSPKYVCNRLSISSTGGRKGLQFVHNYKHHLGKIFRDRKWFLILGVISVTFLNVHHLILSHLHPLFLINR